MDVETVLTELKALPGSDKLDEFILDYVSHMVFEEKCSTVDEMVDLIGPFFEEAGCADVRIICEMLLQKVLVDLSHENAVEKLSDAVILGKTAGLQADGYIDPFLGLQKTNVNFNTQTDFTQVLKNWKQIQKDKDRQLRLMQEWERSKRPPPPPRRCHGGDDSISKFTDIIVNAFDVSIGGKELLRQAPLRLVVGRKYGLIGRNGIGKSTFLNALARFDIPGVPTDLNILHIEQEIKVSADETALDAVLKVDMERWDLIGEEKRVEAHLVELEALPTLNVTQKAELDKHSERLGWIQTRLHDIDATASEPLAQKILKGLGFDEELMLRPTNRLSGGWRMRVALARALFADPDILLLDEPTNHLDLHAVAWLTKYLQNWDKTCVIVSHSRTFLNDVCSDVIHFQNETLEYYRGDYDNFEEVRAEKIKVQQKQIENQEAKRKHVQSFIDRFRYSANRAALVQSRIKALEKLPMLDAVKEDPTLTFSFLDPEALPTPMLQMNGVSFAYSQDSKRLLNNLDMTVDLDSRIAVCGVNGAGKSTLLKLLIGVLEPLEGSVTRHQKLRIGFFSQHHVDTLDLTLTAVQQLQVRYPDIEISDESARSYLGRFGISGMLSIEPLYILSGGQKSRVSIALMAFANPHILVLDEPTNHLDLDAVQALICALNDFKGGVIVVSHDAHMIECVCDEVWHVDPQSRIASKFGGSFEEYREKVLKGHIH